jgi:hypothetical protein
MEPHQGEPASAPVDGDTDPIGPVGLSRREFTKAVGAGSAATVGLAWAAPKISTIRYGLRAVAGSPPPGSTTTTTSTTTPIGAQGTLTVDDPNPCAGTSIHIHASGFARNSAVNLALDSAAHPLGTATANGDGRINVLYKVPLSGPFGNHIVIATGVKPGGQTLVLTAPIVIHTVADCGKNGNGKGSTVSGQTATTVDPPSGQSLQHGSNLPFTGMDSAELALIGGAAALAGWGLYGVSRSRDEDRDDGDDAA